MANSSLPRLRAPKAPDDQPETAAERRRVIRGLRKQGGAHIARPPNGLIQDAPADTVARCKGVISWLAHIDRPFNDERLAAAEADVLLMVVDALEHAEKVIHSVGALADAETDVD